MIESKKNQLGASMIEAIGVLAIMAIVIVGMYSAISGMFGKYKTSRVTSQIFDLQKAIDQRFSASESYAGLENSMLITEKVAPAEITAGSNLVHSFSGKIEVVASAYSYNVTFHNVPKTPCVELLLLDWTSKHNSHLQSVKANATEFVWDQDEDDKLLVTTDAAIAACNNAKEENVITWTFQ